MQAERRECLLAYNDFGSIVGKIKNVVLEGAKRDRMTAMFYHGKVHRILVVHSMLKRRVGINRVQPKKHEKTSGTVSTDE